MTLSECPMCGEPDPIHYPGEADEPAIDSCPECGWEQEAPK